MLLLQVFNTISETFWSPSVWLPPNVTWSQLNGHFNNLYYYPLLFAAVLTFIRYLVEKRIFVPFGIANGLRSKRRDQAPDNGELEKAYQSSRPKKIDDKTIRLLAEKLDWTSRQVERWLRKRTAMDRPLTLTKFAETGWRFTYYLFIFSYGICVLWGKPWFWDMKQCWYGFPEQNITPDLWWYYMLSLGFYLSLLFSICRDVKRKDFWVMLFHHILTILMLAFSWTCNFVRIGSLVLVLADAADVFLESGKMFSYIKYQKTCDTLYALFAIVWFVTRMGFFPFYILKSTLFGATDFIPIYPAYYIFNVMLIALMIMFVYWTYFISKMLIVLVSSAESKKDPRSDSEVRTS